MSTVTSLAGVVKAGAGQTFHVLGHTVHVKVSSADTPGGSYTFELITPPGVLGPPPHVHEREEELIELCKRLGYRYCQRLQIELFGNTRGT